MKVIKYLVIALVVLVVVFVAGAVILVATVDPNDYKEEIAHWDKLISLCEIARYLVREEGIHTDIGDHFIETIANLPIGFKELELKPYLEKMTKSEILCLMGGGMATIAGGVFAAYVGYLGGSDPAQQQLFATHLLTASIISAPAAIMVAKMLFPEDTPEKINTNLNLSKDKIGIVGTVWSACGADVNLRVNASMMVRTNRQKDDALATVDSADISSGLVYNLQWKRCNSSGNDDFFGF